MKIKNKAMVELSHKMIPGKENFKLEAAVSDATTIDPKAVHRADVWNVVSEITFSSHVGTHIEFPFHHLKQGADASTYPLENLIGEGVILNFTNRKAGDAITIEDVKRQARRIKQRDIIFFRTDLDKKFRSSDWEPFPYIQEEALAFLLEFNPKVIGTDASGIEVPGTDYQPNHTNCFKKNVAIVESATNLAALGNERATIFILPLRIEGVDSCPVRIIALT